MFLLVNRKVSNWIVFREKSDNFLKCLWFSCDLWGFWWVERKCILDGIRKCVLKILQNIFITFRGEESFGLVNRKVSNWIVYREKSDSFLKCLWFNVDLWGFWWVERKCMLDGVHNVCWRYFRIYLLHLEARSLLIGKSQCQIELCSEINLTFC